MEFNYINTEDIKNYINTNDIKKFTKALKTYVPPADQGHNILHESVTKNRHEISKLILDKFPDLSLHGDYPYLNTPLMYAIWARDKEMIDLFGTYKQSFRIHNDMGEYPLHMAIKTKNISVVKQIYNYDKHVITMKNVDGWYPLHVAASYGTLEIAKFLHKEFPEHIQEVDTYKQTPLHLCGKFLNNDMHITKNLLQTRIIRYLASNFPKAVEMKNSIGELPIHMITMTCVTMTDIVRDDIKFIINMFPASLHIASDNGMLPIHISSFFHDIKLTKLFIKHAPETLYISNKNNKIPLDYFDTAPLRIRSELYSYILSLSSPPELFWKRISKPSPGIEKYLYDVYTFSRENAMKLITYCTKNTQKRIHSVYNILQLVARKNYNNIEDEIFVKITLMSL